MWEAWEGRHAFESLPLPMLSYRVAHLQHRPPVPPASPQGYASLMQRCWSHDPKARPAMGEVLPALRGLLAELLLESGAASDGVESPPAAPP